MKNNFEKIKDMTPSQMADWLNDFHYCTTICGAVHRLRKCEKCKIDIASKDTKKDIEKWLKIER